MPCKLRLLLIGVLFYLVAGRLPLAAQSVQQRHIDASDPAHLYRSRKTHQGLSFYCLPTVSTPRGILLLLTGFGSPARNVFKETALGQEAAHAGLVTVVPTLNNRLYLDSASTRFLDTVLKHVRQQYPTVGSTLCIGGFSAGGHLALTYAETLVRDTARLPLRVQAVFGVDSPVDLAAFWQQGQRRITQNCHPVLVKEGRSMVATLTQAFGGSPAQEPTAYAQYSAFSNSSAVGGNLAWLAAIPVRVYCEPNLTFWRQRYCATLQVEDLNAALLRPMIDCLRRQGNSRAHYIETSGKGYIGKRSFPHAWSIVDASDCIRWLVESIATK